ncbi:MAG: efflux RND transporter periplasmic adaptor subunit [Pseudomonadales bacterium]|nr:efflux RND transporter periplasmic adaptor subunit [Halioglobus sp.]MCP5128693.1 efflux RND transporter periplasmic adaptor subunit [Pseudomonadales bacterium]
MSKNVLSASIIAIGLLLWLGSGLFSGESAPKEHPSLTLQEQALPESGGKELSRVRVEPIKAQARTRYLVLRGRTESKRMVQVKSEIAGQIVSRPVERGMRVARGDLLCEVAVDDREAAVVEAKAAFENARIEYEGALKLKAQGLQSQIAIAGSAARQEAARAQLQRQELNLERTRISAPFDGVVEDLHMNTGDYATPGAPCVTLIDLDPMLVKADVSETEVENLGLGDRAFGQTSVGGEIVGLVTFVGKQSDPVTRTYPVEITVENGDYSIRSGLTVSARIGLGDVQAHQVSPALFTLNDAGEIGLRTVDKANRVVFHTVRIIEDGPEGVWVTGLPRTTRLITVGQEFVADGEVIEPMYSNDPGTQVAQP